MNTVAVTWKQQLDTLIEDAITRGKKIHMLWLMEELNYNSRKKLERDFRRHLNTTYCSYLCELRLKKACDLLTESNLSLKAIALSSGYQSPATFCNAFRKKFGLSPSQYRSQLIIKMAS
jgi:transcriptional regulator GlxA family with amidase domain